jgi:two-component system, NtrC family, sensor kinase
MNRLLTLRRELIGGFAVVFTGALLIATIGVLFAVPRLMPGVAVVYVATLLSAVVAVFTWFGARMLRQRVLDPLETMVSSVEAISEGDLGMRVPGGGTAELARLSAAVNALADTLIADRQALTENIQSLDETNRLLTEARDAMIHAEKMASVGRLGAGIAHEVGNPLGAIIGYLGLIRRQGEGRSAELAEAAEREAHRIDRIIRGLLDFARPRDAASQPLDVNAVVRDTVELVATQGHFKLVSLEPALADDVPLTVAGDPYQLQQVLVNLLVNAADAAETVRDPRVRVSTARRAARPAPPHVPARRRDDPKGVDYSHRRRLARLQRWPEGDPDSETGQVVEITIADNGPGVPAELLDKVFEPFVTTKEPGKGTGLGLALCARLVEGMGGAIRAGNTAEGGAVFRVILPAVAAEVMET